MWGIKSGTNTLEVKVKDEKKNFAIDVSIDGFLDTVNIPNAIHSKAAITQSSRTSPSVKGKINIKFLEGMKVRITKDSTGKRKLVDLNGTSLLALERVFSSFNITKIANPIHLKTEEMDAIEVKMESELNTDVPNGNLFYRLAFDESISVWSVIDEIKKLPYIEEAFPDFEGTKPNFCEIPNDPAVVSNLDTTRMQYDWLDKTHITDSDLFVESTNSSTTGTNHVFTPNKKSSADKTNTIIMNDESKWGAWRYGRGNENIGVAILDSFFEHPNMCKDKDCKYQDDASSILLHEDFDPNKIEFVSNVANRDIPVSIYNSFHGTAAAGIIGAKANNNLGIAGITDAKMLWVSSHQNAEQIKTTTGTYSVPYKIDSSYNAGEEYTLDQDLSNFNSFDDSLYMLGTSKYDWVKVILQEREFETIDNGVLEPNSGKTTEMIDPIYRYWTAYLVNKGKIVVIPAGNTYETDIRVMTIEETYLNDKTLYFETHTYKGPVPDTGSIIVGGVNLEGTTLPRIGGLSYSLNSNNNIYYNYGLTKFDSNGNTIQSSNTGHGIDICAPAEKVYSTGSEKKDNNKYFMFGGTSAASPIISAVAQLMLSVNPNLSPIEIRRILRITTKEKNLGITTPDGTKTTAGMVNAYEAVKMANGGRKPEPACSKINITGQPDSITYNTKSIPVVTNGAKIEVKAGDQIAIPITPSIKNQLNNVSIGGIQLTLLEIVQNYAIYGVPDLGKSTGIATTRLIDIVIKNNLGQTVETLADALKILLDAINNVRKFPDSVTVNGVTTNLDYGYIFKPQSENDYKDYSSNNLAGVKLITKNYYDIPAKWVNDNGSWGIDFSSSPFSAVEVPDGNYEFGTNYTTVTLVKLVNDDSINTSANDGFILSKWWANHFYDHSKLNNFTSKQLYLINTNQGKDPNTGDIYYVFKTDNNVTENNIPFAISESLNTVTNIKTTVKNQNILSNSFVDSIYPSRSLISVTNGAGRMFLGNYVSESDYAGLLWGKDTGIQSNENNLKGVLYGFAIIKQSLSDEQIKELHKQMGF